MIGMAGDEAPVCPGRDRMDCDRPDCGSCGLRQAARVRPDIDMRAATGPDRARLR